MRYLERKPSPALAPFVKSIWRFDGALPEARERILPSGAMQLLVNLHEDELRSYDGDGYSHLHTTRGAALSGAFSRHFAIDTQEQRSIVGVAFHPGGASPFFRAPASEVAETHVGLDALWGRDGLTLRERLLDERDPAAQLVTLERVLVAHALGRLDQDRAVGFAVAALEAQVTVGAVVDKLGMSPRRFIQRFADVVGLTPKRFARVRRFQGALAALEAGRPVQWARLSADVGYFDQAHLIKDFRDFAGISPTAYAPRPAGGRNHVALDL